MTHSPFVQRSTMSLVLATGRARGWIYALNIGVTILRGRMRSAFQAHYSRLRALVLVLMGGFGLGLLYWIGTGPLSLNDAVDVAKAAAVLLTSLLLLFLALSHALVPGRLRGQAVLALVRVAVFSLLVIVVGWLAYDGWRSLWLRAPVGSTLFGLVAVTILYSFRDVINVMIHSTLVRQQLIDVSMVQSLTETGRRRVSYHEAGHVLCYALAEGIPEDAMVSLNTEVYGFLAGAVYIPTPNDPTEVTRDYMDVRLRILVAGKVAEEIVFDEDACLGAVMDMQVFQQHATLFLQAGFGDGYIHEPNDETDRRINLAAVEGLRHSLERQVREFLMLNRALLDQAAAHLLKFEFLGCEELDVMLTNVCLPQEWRKRQWPQSVPLYMPKT